MESLRAKAKANEVARLLLDLSNSEITPLISTQVEMAHYACVVQGLMDLNVSHTVWDSLLRLLKELSLGYRFVEASLDLSLT
jgi:hypothetical protein